MSRKFTKLCFRGNGEMIARNLFWLNFLCRQFGIILWRNDGSPLIFIMQRPATPFFDWLSWSFQCNVRFELMSISNASELIHFESWSRIVNWIMSNPIRFFFFLLDHFLFISISASIPLMSFTLKLWFCTNWNELAVAGQLKKSGLHRC